MKRDLFLANIAQRLGREPGQVPDPRSVVGVSDSYRANSFGHETVAREDWPERFSRELTLLGGRCLIVSTAAAAALELRLLLCEMAAGTIITWDPAEFDGWEVEWLWTEHSATAYISSDGSEQERAALMEAAQAADVGITTVQFAAVNTGTLVLFTNKKRNRSVSLLPAVHIALVRESQLTASIGVPLESLVPEECPSSVHFISGPSRSADIENDLSIGVHGPAAVIVILALGW